jgi:hypothetical protein
LVWDVGADCRVLVAVATRAENAAIRTLVKVFAEANCRHATEPHPFIARIAIAFCNVEYPKLGDLSLLIFTLLRIYFKDTKYKVMGYP